MTHKMTVQGEKNRNFKNSNKRKNKRDESECACACLFDLSLNSSFLHVPLQERMSGNKKVVYPEYDENTDTRLNMEKKREFKHTQRPLQKNKYVQI